MFAVVRGLREICMPCRGEIPDHKMIRKGFMETNTNATPEVALEAIITNAVKLPLVKVDRDSFLAETFASTSLPLPDVLEKGPVAAGASRKMLSTLSQKLIVKRTSQSSIASFAAGIPGGLAMAATVPADVLQFFGMSLRLAQELSYLYGARDLWQNGEVSETQVQSQLILYCGVMFGVSGAISGVRVLSTQIAKTTLKRLPQKALMKTFWYPIVKQIGKAIGVKVTKTTLARGVSKAIPIVGGVISGGLNFASMLPMANRLQETLDRATFDYTDEQFEEDISVIESIAQNPTPAETSGGEASDLNALKGKVTTKFKSAGSNLAGMFSKKKPSATDVSAEKSKDASPAAEKSNEIMANIEKLYNLKEKGILSQEEFDSKKAELLSRI